MSPKIAPDAPTVESLGAITATPTEPASPLTR